MRQHDSTLNSGLVIGKQPRIGACAILRSDGGYHDLIDLAIAYEMQWIEFKFDPPYLFPEHLSRTDLKAIREIGKAKGIGFSMHAPHHDVNIGALNPMIRAACVNEIKRTVDVATELGCVYLTIHGGDVNGELSHLFETVKQNTIESLRVIAEYCRPRGIKLSVENGNPANQGRKKIAIKPEEVVAVVTAIGQEAGTTVDLGHANLSGIDPLVFIEAVDPERILVMHVHDNLGQTDEHRSIGSGMIDYPEFVRRYLAGGWSFPAGN